MLSDSSLPLFAAVAIASVVWKRRQADKFLKNNAHDTSCSPEVARLRRLMASGQLTHPFLRAQVFQRQRNEKGALEFGIEEEQDCVANFTDLANALALCCGVNVNVNDTVENAQGRKLARDIGTRRRHIIIILCDGLGNAVLKQHLPSDDDSSAFLCRNNQWDRLRAVFPSTTPAALTTLATAAWPGQHGVPGWDWREQPSCEYPGTNTGDESSSTVQLRILAPRVMNVRTGKPALDGDNYSSLDDVFVLPPWSRNISKLQTMETKRRMIYVNAYNGDDFPSWYQGTTDGSSPRHATDFSSWQTGQTQEATTLETTSTLLDVATIGETSFSTLGKPEGAQAALQYLKDGIHKALRSIAQAEASGESTFTYLYTAHPDKHMHALGTSHEQVETLIKNINAEIEQMWNTLGDCAALLEMFGVSATNDAIRNGRRRVDAALVVTADHGHVSVDPQDMVMLPDTIIDCLEYANIGVHGKGRHGYLHCRAGLQSTMRERWRVCPELNDSFLLLKIEEASDHGLFGPQVPAKTVRPRLGDFVAIAVSERTLVTPNEWNAHKEHCQGAHGSLLGAEMEIPFILCTPSQD